jgi:gamma-glutamyltranspeptidase / glutathione hydrolase
MAAPGFTTRPELLGTFGVVSSTHWIASQVGMSVLEKGGNAFDAAVAAGFVLQVVEPHMNGLGGDAVILIKPAGDEQPTAICGQGPAPAGATLAHYRSEGIEVIPGNGLLAACVPGAFDSWMLMLRDHGTMTLAEVMAPAVFYASEGFPIVAGAVGAIRGVADLFATQWQSSAAVWLPDGKPPAVGSIHRNRDLAQTLARLVRLGAQAGPDREAQIDAARRAFYAGFVAEMIDPFVTRTPVLDATGEKHRGVLRAADMASWSASYESCATVSYRGWQVFKAGPWSQGPVMLQVLKLLEGFDIGAMDTLGAEFVHTIVEAKKLAYADRESWYGEPIGGDVPIQALLSDAYATQRRQLIGAEASREMRPGAPGGRNANFPAWRSAGAGGAAGVGEPARVEQESYDRSGGGASLAGNRAARGPAEGDTCHLDVIDRWGNVVAATPSGGWLQSSPVIPGLGFCLGTRAQMFWMQEGLPSTLRPGARPRTTLTPTIAQRGDTTMAFGSPGGDNQDQWILQFFLRHADHGLNLQAAIDAPQLQCDHWPNSFYPRHAAPAKLQMEGRFPASTVEELRRRGHEVNLVGDWTLGRNCAASTDGRIMKAAATPRLQQAYAVGR